MLKFHTVAELAISTPYGAEALREALRAGKLHGVQNGKGGTWRVAEPCMEAFMLGNACEHQAEKMSA